MRKMGSVNGREPEEAAAGSNGQSPVDLPCLGAGTLGGSVSP